MYVFRARFSAASLALLAAGLALLTPAHPAVAGDMLGYFMHGSDAEVGTPKWTGFIVDPDWGYERLNFDGTAGALLKEADGLRLGAEVGYDVDINGVVLGIVGGAFYSWIDGDGRGAARGRLDTDMDYLGTIRGRLGYAFGRFMVYGTGGWAFGDLEITNSAGVSDDTSLSGWAAGGGVEYMWNRNFSVRLEYIHLDYGDERFSSLPVGADIVEPDMELFNFGLITRF